MSLLLFEVNPWNENEILTGPSHLKQQNCAIHDCMLIFFWHNEYTVSMFRHLSIFCVSTLHKDWFSDDCLKQSHDCFGFGLDLSMALKRESNNLVYHLLETSKELVLVLTSKSNCETNRPFTLRGHETSFLWNWHDFTLKKRLVRKNEQVFSLSCDQ